ncbi:FtsX-like permease family protein [Streptomyces sp. NPDC051569]|uniref:FtsX-like permease family protein n=1 Tax=Streptomyces sp. NPDC051569 TaxID=3365661 RepID=UPI0037B1DD8B
MTLLDQRAAPAPTPPPAPAAGGRGSWLRDLQLGVKFAAAGGREGWTRTALTALGVGFGVAMLFLAASIPHMTDARAARQDARSAIGYVSGKPAERTDATLLWALADTEYHNETITGRLLRAEGPRTPAPPGVGHFPGPGEMAVSPALRDLLDSPGGELLKQRLDYRVTGIIGDAGLLDSGELFYYAGNDSLSTEQGAKRAAGFGSHVEHDPLDPALVVLVILICVALLVPVGIFITTAVRFGGDRRDRRLAALRLVGADTRMTRRIAAGEALFGAIFGLLVGVGVFLAVRPLAGTVRLWTLAAFPADVVPVPALAALIVLAVPAGAVAVTLFALRSVAIEPLGVVRNARPRRRRVWWRLLVPVAGVALLTMTGGTSDTEAFSVYPVAAGAVLVLVGLTLLLPWLVEAVVSRLHGGPVPWQLATRRLQLSSGSAARAVSGITVAVAGAVSLQMLFSGVQANFTKATGADPTRATVTATADFPNGELAQKMIDGFRATKGVTSVIGTVQSYAAGTAPRAEGEGSSSTLVVIGTCATLREVAHITSCQDGDTFVSHLPGQQAQTDAVGQAARPGKPLDLNMYGDEDGTAPQLWTLPAATRTVAARPDPAGNLTAGVLATPGALDPSRLPTATTIASILVDERVPDAREYVRNTAARIYPAMGIFTISYAERAHQFNSVRSALLIGATGTMGLIAISLLVTQLEQLRERRRLLSVLVAFGTRRSTLAWSVLWQTAVPVVVGTALAVAGGLTLGAVLLRLVDSSVSDWWVFLPFAAAGIGVILVVTLVSLPPLWRMMRPEGLRSE